MFTKKTWEYSCLHPRFIFGPSKVYILCNKQNTCNKAWLIANKWLMVKKKQPLKITLYFLNQSINRLHCRLNQSHITEHTSKHAWLSQQMMSCMSISVTRWPIPDVSGQLKHAWGLATFYCRSLFLSIHSHLCEDCDSYRRLKVIEADLCLVYH